MSKIIIHNHSKAEDTTALWAVLDVAIGGRVSGDGKCYCYATTYPVQGLRVFADVTKAGTDKFLVFDAEAQE